MSDKFFFKGRQHTRQDHINHGYRTRASYKPGSKKYPLSLLVISEARQQEVAALVAATGLYADIIVDHSDDAVESIGELTVLLDKTSSVTVDKMPSRNDPCSCGSGKKFKKCCGH